MAGSGCPIVQFLHFVFALPREEKRSQKKKKKRKNGFLAGRPAASGLQCPGFWGCYLL
jgi:4'-phosphopantetheinyl transferase EntD